MRCKQACIIAATRLEGRLLLLKNRDRIYKPRICVLRTKITGVEMCGLYDKITGFFEGMNEHGIGVVNSALMVEDDEREGQEDSEQDRKVFTTNDGRRILKALTFDDVDEVVESLKTNRKGIHGHTFVSDGKRLVVIEHGKSFTPRVKELDPKRVNVRTNHGIIYSDLGYTHGDDYVSSIVRRWESQKRIRKLDKIDELAPSLVTPIHDEKSPFNMVRKTDTMVTRSQMVLDLDSRQMRLYYFPSSCKYEGVVKTFDEKPKIDLRVFKYKKR